MACERNGYIISTDRNRLDIPYIHNYLSEESYWSKGIPFETVKRSIENSMPFGIYSAERQVGFARVIIDCATFAYLADVFIDPEHRGKGLSKWLMEVILSHPSLQNLRRFLLATRDAHGLYSQFGFRPVTDTTPWMHIHAPDLYQMKKTERE